MSTREAVKDYQHRLAELDASHSRANRRLEAARQKRMEVLATQDELVAGAERAVDDSVVSMAAEVGPELAANLLALDVQKVRRLLKGSKQKP